ncbi:transporter substrate-binding domain-containing protein [Alkalicoccobacillus plakortidis]|uniref:Transporter substrate-binding domain-containing protein n=1 Tax=Alkalicoccobacillus plakortidis TaxID=444060 RepID=A0ABT0XKZ4_9BACI|nr:transporter substrate-binding domain-containing protein [Alkalicoccobacillus plakortidis]MCM2676581.1 transporter substrate-binding domain-containing protein [Alkalicoccobacillus plakortidis]
MLELLKNKRISTSASFIVGAALIGVLGACSSGSESADESTESVWDKVQEEGKIVAATSGTLYPTSYHADDSDELTGFEVEILREAANRLDLDIEFSEMGIDNILTAVNNGRVDIAANDIDITEDREEKFSFSDPYKHSYGSAIVRSDDLSGIETLDDLEGKKAGGAATTIYMQIGVDHGAEEVIYDNVTNDTYLRDVENGRLDVILNDYYLQSLAVEALPEIDVVVHPTLAYFPSIQGIIMKKDETELQEQINSAINEMLEDGTITELSQQFFGGADVSQEPDVEIEEQ